MVILTVVRLAMICLPRWIYPANVCSMVEIRGEVLGGGLESSWIFLDGRNRHKISHLRDVDRRSRTTGFGV